MSDLIERLRLARRMVAGQHDTATIDEAITALSPVLPDDVAEQVAGARRAGYNHTADLLERQLRNYESACRLMEMKDDDRDKLQQRIEELETLVSALEEVRAKEYTHKQQRIEELTLTLRDQAHLHKMETTGLRKVIEELESQE